MNSDTTPTMTPDDWAELEAALRGGPPDALATQAHAPARPPPEPEPPPPKVKTSDQIVAEALAEAARVSPEVRAPSEPCRPPTALGKGALGGPRRLAQHERPVRAEVTELRRELEELTRLVREIHTRVVVEGGKP